MSRREDWRDQALCLGREPDLFFPVGTTGSAVGQIIEAKQVCATCPVSAPCLEWAVQTGTENGVFGGLDENERRAARRRRQRHLRVAS